MSATLPTEDILVIETPERVPLHFALASIGNRFIACAIDHAIQGVAIGLIALTAVILMSFPAIEQAVSSGAIERPAGAPSKRPDNDARHIAQHSNPSRPVMLRYERDRGGDISERNVALALGGDRIDGHSFDDCLWRKGANKRYEKPIDDEADRVHLSLTITCVSV